MTAVAGELPEEGGAADGGADDGGGALASEGGDPEGGVEDEAAGEDSEVGWVVKKSVGSGVFSVGGSTGRSGETFEVEDATGVPSDSFFFSEAA